MQSNCFVRYEKTLLRPNYWKANTFEAPNGRLIDQWYTGITYAIIREGNALYIGVSRCSKHDNFDKKIARQIAIGRAETAMLDPNRRVCFDTNIIMTRSTWTLLGNPIITSRLPETLLALIEYAERSQDANVS